MRLMSPPIGDPKILLPQQIVRDKVINVRAQLSHPMYTGLSNDAQGHPIPAYFVSDVVVHYGNEEIAHFTWTSGISRDPYVAFPVKATREAPLTITWKDNKGGVYRQSADIKFSA
jgi:sulfur-oxidizing protein SoxZ